MEYEVEFYAGNSEFDYDIDAMSGAIRSKDQDCEFYTPAPDGAAAGSISQDMAMETAESFRGFESKRFQYPGTQGFR